MAAAAAFRFGPFVVDPASYRVTRAGAPLALSPKLIDLLLVLAAEPAALVSKEALFAALWPDVAVTDNALTQAISDLRQALGDDAAHPLYIQTVARRGYRFVAPVEAIDPAGAAPAGGAPAPAPVRVAVLEFENVTGDPELAWLGAGIAETVTTGLRTTALRVVDRTLAAQAGRDLATLRRLLSIDRAVVGSVQRAGDRLRIVARIVDAGTGECVAEAHADGRLDEIFDLQDRIILQLAAAASGEGRVTGRRLVRETSSLAAYQLLTQGRLRLESLEAAEITRAEADFAAAIELEPGYAAAHVGMANAVFLQFELSRARGQPDRSALAAAIGHARRALELDGDFAEAHATLAFLLVGAGRAAEARASARRAVALEPGYWGHRFRLAHATWGSERLTAIAGTLEAFPEFPYAHFEAAMVHVARGALEAAESTLREGAAVQDRQAQLRLRYPAGGLHWLLGLVRLARGDGADAVRESDREIAAGAARLYGPEFTMNAHDTAGCAHLAGGDPAAARKCFERALAMCPDRARSLTGLAAALRAGGGASEADAVLAHAGRAVHLLQDGGRTADALIIESCRLLVSGRAADALQILERVIELTEPPSAGWTLPIEPLLAPLYRAPAWRTLLARLAERAR